MAGPGRIEWARPSNVPDKSCPFACSTMRDLGAVVFAGPATTMTAGEVESFALRGGEQATEAAGPCKSMPLRPTFSSRHVLVAMMSLVNPHAGWLADVARDRMITCRELSK